jgi:ABC-2 type transport system permease protein
MTEVQGDAAVLRAREQGRVALATRAFWGLLHRDMQVLARDAGPFTIRTIMNPLFLVFVFAYVFPKSGQHIDGPAGSTFGTVILPGIVGVTIFFQGIAAVAMPLSLELDSSGEIEDRLMAPLPIAMVGIEKIAFSSLQSILAAALVFPITYFIPADKVYLHVSSMPLLVTTILIASTLAGSLGLFVGTVLKPRNIGTMFSLIVVPITFLGCVYYPWASLSSIHWLQVLILANPLMYVNEALRASMTPSVPHLPIALSITSMLVACLILSWVAILSFGRRVTS